MTRCIDKSCTDGPTIEDRPAPRLTRTGLLCDRCTGHLERRLAELPARADQVRSVLAGRRKSQSDGSRRTKGNPPVPLNLAAHDHLELMQATLVSWSQLVAEERDLRGPDIPTVQVLSGWLLNQLDWLRGQPWVDDLAEEMRDVSRTADGLARVQPQWNRLPAPCPGCDAHDLGRWDGDDHVGCAACGERWPEDDYARLVLVLASDSDRSLPMGEAVERAGVPAATFRQWVSRGKVRRLGTAEGQARYSVEDIDAARGKTA
jgi:hypothetical protein